MKEATLMKNLRDLQSRCDVLHASLLEKESTIFALWSVVNVLLKILKETETLQLKQDAKTWLPKAMQMVNQPIFTQEMFEQVGAELHAEREAKIKELAEKSKETGEPINADDMPTDHTRKAVESLPTHEAFQAEAEEAKPKLEIVRKNFEGKQ